MCVFLLSLSLSELDAAQHAGTSDDITAPNLKSCCASKIKPGEPSFFFFFTFEVRQNRDNIIKVITGGSQEFFLKGIPEIYYGFEPFWGRAKGRLKETALLLFI